MGKIRVKTIGNEEQEEAEKYKKATKNAEKLSRAKSASGGKARMSADETIAETEETPEAPQKTEVSSETKDSEQSTPEIQNAEKTEAKPTKKSKKKKFAKSRKRSTNYSNKIMEIDKNKSYPLSEALELLRKVKLAKFDETVELHINTTEAGISGQVKLPHGTGKEIRVAIASDEVLAEVEEGKINFDILIAAPSEMPKLARVARILGPRGLMPNPKNGTISDNPEEAMKKFQGGQISFKTENKTPLIHLSVGKTSFGDKELTENIKTIITAVKKDRIRKITLKSSMSPGIRLQI